MTIFEYRHQGLKGTAGAKRDTFNQAKNLKRIMVRDGMMRGRGLMMKGRGFMFLLYIY